MNIFTNILKLLVILVAVDAVWLYARSDYHNRFFASVQGGSPLRIRAIPAVIVYVLLAIAVLFVAVRPATSIRAAALRGAAVGAIMYGFYDATNLATLSNWTWNMAIVDTLWGTVACAAAAAATAATLKLKL